MVSERDVVACLLNLASIDKNDWETAIQQILKIDAGIMGIARVNYWTFIEDPKSIVCEMGYVADPEGFERGLVIGARSAPRYFHELERAKLIAVENARTDPRTADLADYLARRHITGLLDVPVWMHGVLAGVLCHENTGPPRKWTDADLDFAVSVAQVVCSALEARYRNRAEGAERRALLLDQVSRELVECRETKSVAERALALAVPRLADAGFIDIVDGDALTRVAIAHATREGCRILEDASRRSPPTCGGPGLSAHVIVRGESLLLPSFGDGLSPGGLESAMMVEELGIRSIIAVPLLAPHGAIGGLVLGSASHSYVPDDLSFVEELAKRITAAMENARLHKKASDAIRARDQFISLAAHELHTPLASLQLASESLSSRASRIADGDLRFMGDSIVRQVGRLNRLVDNMLDASKVGARKFSLSMERVDLSRLVRDVLGGFEARAESNLRVDVQEGVFGRWDSTRLEQVIANLVDNAIKFGRGNPIDVTLRRDGTSAVFTVRDRGIGITQEKLRFIFDPFERAVSSRSYGGLGLGLFVAKAIVDAHGGRIDVESIPAEGSTFRVSLPGAEEPS